MTQIWQQIRLGKHAGFEEGESSYTDAVMLAQADNPSLAIDRRTAGLQAVVGTEEITDRWSLVESPLSKVVQ
jgi:hypothetical protein